MGCNCKKNETTEQKKQRLFNEAIKSGLPLNLAYKYAGYTDKEIEELNK